MCKTFAFVVPETLVICIKIRLSFGVLWCRNFFLHSIIWCRKTDPDHKRFCFTRLLLTTCNSLNVCAFKENILKSKVFVNCEQSGTLSQAKVVVADCD